MFSGLHCIICNERLEFWTFKFMCGLFVYSAIARSLPAWIWGTLQRRERCISVISWLALDPRSFAEIRRRSRWASPDVMHVIQTMWMNTCQAMSIFKTQDHPHALHVVFMDFYRSCFVMFCFNAALSWFKSLRDENRPHPGNRERKEAGLLGPTKGRLGPPLALKWAEREPI